MTEIQIKNRKNNNRDYIYLLSSFLKENIVWIVVAVFFIIFSIIFPTFFSERNLLNLARRSFVVGIMAIGMSFAMISGSFDLSVGATMGLTTVIVIQLQPSNLLSMVIAILVGLSIGLLVGLVNGLLVGRAGTNSVIATIGISFVVLGINLIYTRGNHVWIQDIYKGFEFIGAGSIGKFPFPAAIFLFIIIVSQFVLRLTKFGREIYSTGASKECSIFSGINVDVITLKCYLISGFTASLAGVVTAARVYNVDPTFAVGTEFDVLTAVLIGGVSLFGGKGNAINTAGGVFLFVMINNIMTLSGMNLETQSMVKGVLLVIIVSVYSLFREKSG